MILLSYRLKRAKKEDLAPKNEDLVLTRNQLEAAKAKNQKDQVPKRFQKF